jgi:hypothetical protein
LENKDARARSGILKGLDSTRSPHRYYSLVFGHVRGERPGTADHREQAFDLGTRRYAASPGTRHKGRSLKTEERESDATHRGRVRVGRASIHKGRKAARHLPAYERRRITSVQLGSGQS